MLHQSMSIIPHMSYSITCAYPIQSHFRFRFHFKPLALLYLLHRKKENSEPRTPFPHPSISSIITARHPFHNTNNLLLEISCQTLPSQHSHPTNPPLDAIHILTPTLQPNHLHTIQPLPNTYSSRSYHLNACNNIIHHHPPSSSIIILSTHISHTRNLNEQDKSDIGT